jgi:hypothetical protein
MRILIYKMTHDGDPDPTMGLWGIQDCMGVKRDLPYNAVIAIGGRQFSQPTSHFDRVVWVGSSPTRIPLPTLRGSLVHFATFCYYGATGPTLSSIAPALSAYASGVSRLTAYASSLGVAIEAEAQRIMHGCSQAIATTQVPDFETLVRSPCGCT